MWVCMVYVSLVPRLFGMRLGILYVGRLGRMIACGAMRRDDGTMD